ncbi:MAG: shikimate dehydrogenase [Candidatus Limnocylindrales bacterium]
MAKRVVLIGHPVGHSLSGELQQAAFDALGIEAVYESLDKPLIELPDAIASLRGDDYLGANITVPFKERVVPMIDRLTEEAQATGAVDTLTREGAKLIGHNTDVLGFRPALDALIGKQKMPKMAMVLGAGGGARAVVYALIVNGFQRIIVFNRHLHRAEGLVRHFSRIAAHMELRAMPWHESVIEAELIKAKLLVNASSIGRDVNESPIPAELLQPDLMVLDLLYTPKETRLLREAKSASAAAVMNGDLMLLHQSAAAFELWTGRPAPMDLFRERLDAVRDGASADAAPAEAPPSEPATEPSEEPAVAAVGADRGAD